MCGIAGILATKASAGSPDPIAIAEGIAQLIARRGPDDAGTWSDPESGVALAHRRLAIIDLSEAGHQPMVSRSGRWILTYNGETYNFAELRRDLEPAGINFRGHSDTEVLLAAIDEWGVEKTLGRLNGMYAFALWDRRERELTLVRDPLGEKPMYYGWAGEDFIFSSELGALRAHPQCPSEIDKQGLAALLRYKFIPAPTTILRGISKLRAGEMATFNPSLGRAGLRTHRYWDAVSRAKDAFEHQLNWRDEEAIEQLESTLLDAVRLRTIADVPVGAFLSGGIDSSAVVALLAAADLDVKTYSIGFTDPEFDEAPHAARVATHLGTDHRELYFGPSDVLDVVPRIPEIYSEPFADSSQLPTAVVSSLARGHVKVVLSGDGGDELFGGYGRYQRSELVWPRLQRIPAPLRSVAARALGAFGTRFPSSHLPSWRALPPMLRGRALGVGAAGRARGMGAATFADFYHDMLSDWIDPAQVMTEAPAPDWSVWPMIEDSPSERELMMLTDLVTYLPEDILVKVDRASMAVGLETRVPLLDPQVVELSWRLPLEMKVRDGQDKWILRQLAYRHIPRSLLDRPKQGFGAPVHEWLRGPLRGWADDLLHPDRLQAEGHLRPAAIDRIWRDHKQGDTDWSRWLWNILMFQAWLERWGG